MLGDAARALISRRLCSRLGFVRIADYARERLGVSGRTLQMAAWLAARLEALPFVASAFDRSEINWSQARAICRAARIDDQLSWLSRARESSAEELEALSRAVGRDDDPDDAAIDGEPAVPFRLHCPARVRTLWRHTLAFASRVAGEHMPVWRAAEVVAAEASSGRPTGSSFGDRALIVALRLARRMRRLSVRIAPPTSADAATATSGPDAPLPYGSGPAGEDVATLRANDARPTGSVATSTDAFALDARLVDAMAALRRLEPRIGRLLRVVVDHRLYRCYGHRKLDAYVRERLGISTRKAWALVTIERRIRGIPALADAYEGGRLSWVRLLVLLPVIHRDNAEGWIGRARSVTVRRLADEVSWVLERRDIMGPRAALDPPPPGSELASPIATIAGDVHHATGGGGAADECRETSPSLRLQIGAQAAPFRFGAGTSSECQETSLAGAPGMVRAVEIADTEIAFTAPTTVVALFRDTMDAFSVSGEPRWTALERMLRNVVAYWESTPRHRDPVFARDGWRCTVPACSSRRNLHDHHVLYRSRGGDNTRDNRTTVCAAHHLHGIHGGTIRTWGTAPDDLHWELGVRHGAPPLLSYVGDALV